MTCWKGSVPAVFRAMALNFGMLAPYEEWKERLKPYLGNTKKNFILSSFIAGLFASFLWLPFDNMKVKIQKQKPGADGKLPYKNLIDWFAKSAKKEGFFAYWTGITVFWMFVGNHTMLALLSTDLLRFVTGITA